jgi:hypothetical protein
MRSATKTLEAISSWSFPYQPKVRYWNRGVALKDLQKPGLQRRSAGVMEN